MEHWSGWLMIMAGLAVDGGMQPAARTVNSLGLTRVKTPLWTVRPVGR